MKYVKIEPPVQAVLVGHTVSKATYSEANEFSYSGVGKRLLDITLVVLAIPFVLPLIVIAALLVAIDGGKPLYCQIRIGRNGRHFTMWKLRTMCDDADQALESHLGDNPNARFEWNETQKLKQDPRITRIGRFFRKTSIDELPQLWNVLIGDMSLVGPRPMMPDQQSLYPGVAYYHLRPGVTGLWQISDRNETLFEARASYDTLYFRKVSLFTDVAVLMATVGVVIRGTGY